MEKIQNRSDYAKNTTAHPTRQRQVYRTFTDNRGMNEKKVFVIANKDDEKVWNDPNTYKKIYGEESTK